MRDSKDRLSDFRIQKNMIYGVIQDLGKSDLWVIY